MKAKTEHNLYYIQPEKIQGDVFVISGQEFHHLKKVMRKKQGDILLLTDGRGNKYVTKITRVDRSEIHVHIHEKKFYPPAPPVAITLAFVPLKGHRTETILEKGTELGAHGFVAFISRFSVLQRLGDQKITRFKSIVKSAMLQSQQYYLPEVNMLSNIEDLTHTFEQYDQVVVTNIHGECEVVKGKSKILLIIGPEGGFDDREIELFKNHGVYLLKLGAARLRSETAAIAALVKIMTVYGML